MLAKCNNAMQAIEALQKHAVDILFLDIQMPDLTGLELLKTMNKKPAVILTTAYSEYALESYEFNVVDYLLKPIPFERFVQAVNKATELIQLKRKPTQVISSATPALAPTKDHFFVKSNHKSVKIRFDDIYYIQGLREYVSIFTKEKRYVTLEAMKNLEDILPKNKFTRTHKSFIVSIEKVDAVVGNMLEMNKKQIPIGKTYRKEVMRVFS